MGDGAGSSARRVARPQERYMPSPKEYADAWSRLLSKIGSFHAEARARLGVPGGSSTRPAAPSRFLDAGICIGLLDPVSNIMANTICIPDDWPGQPRDEVLVVGAAAADEDLGEMGRRSLRGLIAFLIYFFPYLAEWEAVRYLLLADADLLAAARLLVADRGMMRRFSLTSPASAPAFEAALTLAAQVAKHPQPKHLVHVWMSLSSRLHQALTLLSELEQLHYPLQCQLEPLKAMLDDPMVPNLAMSWDLAASRPQYNNSIANVPYQHTRSLQWVLLDTIHGFYLQAMAMLPSGELRSQLHRSLLSAGHCYGPMDPVSNIINNTIWYHANFPAAETPVLDLIGPDSLTRLESRSLYGLVSFLQTRYHDLSEHQAVQCLIVGCGDLSIADPKLMTEKQQHPHHCLGCHHLLHSIGSPYDDAIRKVEQQSPCAGVHEAYMAAATAAWHPNPKEQAAFLTSWKVHPVADQLTYEDVHRWSYFLSPVQLPTPERICKSSDSVKDGKMRSEAQQRRVSRKVKDALNKHLLQDGKPIYDLHVISCVNENVCGSELCISDSLSFAPYKYRYSHVNFLATPKDSLSSASYPILFFAEFDNEKKDSAPVLPCA